MLIVNLFVVMSIYLDQNKVGIFSGSGWHLCLVHIDYNKLVKA